MEVRHGDVMPGGAQVIGEPSYAVSEALSVIAENDAGHGRFSVSSEGGVGGAGCWRRSAVSREGRALLLW